MGRRAAVVAAGAPLAVVGLLAVQGYLAVSAERLEEADHRIDTTVLPPAGTDGEAPLRLAVFGDSTAAGVGAPTLGGTLPVLIAERVAADLGRPVSVVGYGVSGARTDDVLAEQLPLLAEQAPDVVVVVIGSNDVTHATPWWEMEARTRRLLEAAHEVTGAPVVLGGIPLFGSATLLAQPLRWLVDRYASVLRGAQARAAEAVPAATFVDISRLASPRFRGVPEAMADDQFHPSPVGYGFWADALAPAVAQVAPSGR